jgi:hypothetical protein
VRVAVKFAPGVTVLVLSEIVGFCVDGYGATMEIKYPTTNPRTKAKRTNTATFLFKKVHLHLRNSEKLDQEFFSQ